MLKPVHERIATELGVRAAQVLATVQLLDGGATVPFVARYRKEATGGLDDTQLRQLDERLRYLRDLDERRSAILDSIRAQGKLTESLEAELWAADQKQRLEDLYLPYKPKRRTKAQIAREAGLQPLADRLLLGGSDHPEALAESYIHAEAGVADGRAALDGARHILMEQWAEDAALLSVLRDHLWQNGLLCSQLLDGKNTPDAAKFADYFAYQEPIRQVPSHRALAVLRGRNEGVLAVALKQPEELEPLPRGHVTAAEKLIHRHIGLPGTAASEQDGLGRWLVDSVRLGWRAKLSLSLELELTNRLREQAEAEAIQVFAHNLRDLLLAAPAGPRVTLGLDPGLRTGVKVAVVDQTGKVLDTTAIYPHEPRRDWEGSLATLATLCKRHGVSLLAIGNGTASRETDRLALDLIKRLPDLKLQKLVVSEAGASVYSASELAAKEFPDLDVSLRGAVSIARRLQDPLAELVKIDPKSIGVGQYQHDVNQSDLARALDAVVEDCVNAVGVDVNMASVPLLARVSGLNATLAYNIVAHRDTHGAFRSRAALLQVPRFGDKTFEQATGFLRVVGGDNPLDASSVHPEAYPVVEKILARVQKSVRELMGDTAALGKLAPQQFVDDRFGLPTIRDILRELEKPGRDPRPEFRTADFQEGVETLNDLRVEMVLEGVVTNVTNFGAFVDIGVHQDGLVHISALSQRFVKDPREVVKAGQVVKVKVLEVDLARKRIALTMRLDDVAAARSLPAGADSSQVGGRSGAGGARPARAGGAGARKPEPATHTAMAAAFAQLKGR